ncbi:MAG: THUMP domain-containing class I SAM-dependent RNA methyltransferase [Luteibaculum sp.]
MEYKNWVAKTFFGLEQILEAELKQLGAKQTEVLNRAVKFEASLAECYEIIPSLRTANAVICELFEFNARNPEQLYKEIFAFNWPSILHKNGTFRVEAIVQSEFFNHSKYVALKCKDAVADLFQKHFKARPNVSFENPDLVIHLHIFNEKVRVGLNANDIPLFKRGYKLETGIAPLNECLAAGILLEAGWPNFQELRDPMCGSGTFAIEAALIARNVAPNKDRKWFGFMGWREFNRGDFNQAIKNIIAKENKNSKKIVASDIDSEVLGKARSNARRAMQSDQIIFTEGSFFNRPRVSPGENCLIVLNPPYNERMQTEELEELYTEIGNSLKKYYPGSKCHLISSDIKATKSIGLKANSKSEKFNGGLKIQHLSYEMFEGDFKSFKKHKA